MPKQWTDMDTDEKLEFLRTELIRAGQAAHQIRANS